MQYNYNDVWDICCLLINAAASAFIQFNQSPRYHHNASTMRRVVVTGLGAITPLGVGIRPTWSRLLAGNCGIVSLPTNYFEISQRESLPSTIAGLVPSGSDAKDSWRASDWLEKGEDSRMAKFTQYAIAATEMALQDAGWRPQKQEDKESTGVCLGSGIGGLDELYTASNNYSRMVIHLLFKMKILIEIFIGLQISIPFLRTETPHKSRRRSYLNEIWI